MSDLHVLWLPSWYPAGPQDLVGSFFREQVGALAAGGVRVGVLAPQVPTVPARVVQALTSRPPGAGTRRDQTDWWGLEDGIAVARPRATQFISTARRISTVMVMPTIMRAWYQYVERWGRAQVIHAHSLYPAGFLADALSRRTGVPWVLTEHRSLTHMPQRTPIGRASERAVVGRAAARTAVSRGHAAFLAHRFGGAAGQWVYLPNLVPDPGRLPGRDLWPLTTVDSLEGRVPVLGHLSMLNPEKRVDLLIVAFEALRASGVPARLRIAGPLDSADGRATAALVAASPFSADIELVGALRRDQVPAFTAGLDVFVLPSDTEPFGVVLLEALAQGTPVIATRTWGGQTVVGAGDGWLTDVGDAASLAEAMRQACREIRGAPIRRLEAQRRERAQRCRTQYGPAAFTGRWRRVYNSVARSRRQD